MKFYGFTVTKAGTETIPINKIHSMDYNKVWDHWSDKVTLIYKVQHHGNNHIHFHGLIQTSTNFKDLMMEGYSIRFEKPTDLQRWHNYCLHEINDEYKEVKKKNTEIKIIKRFYERPQLQQQHILLKLNIIGSI